MTEIQKAKMLAEKIIREWNHPADKIVIAYDLLKAREGSTDFWYFYNLLRK